MRNTQQPGELQAAALCTCFESSAHVHIFDDSLNGRCLDDSSRRSQVTGEEVKGHSGGGGGGGPRVIGGVEGQKRVELVNSILPIKQC